MPEFDAEAILTQLNANGYAVTAGDPSRIEFAFALARAARPVLQGHGRKLNSLVPMSKQIAPPRTLSAVYGIGEQPLHSDGAHLPEPPDIIVLSCRATSTTPTVVWKAPSWPPEFVRFGLFTVHGNGSSFMAAAFDNHRLRFDPVCMSPADSYAVSAVRYFADQRSDAYVHKWDSKGTNLFIDNRRALHARDAIADDDDAASRQIDRLAFKLEEPR